MQEAGNVRGTLKTFFLSPASLSTKLTDSSPVQEHATVNHTLLLIYETHQQPQVETTLVKAQTHAGVSLQPITHPCSCICVITIYRATHKLLKGKQWILLTQQIAGRLFES
jgi:hypothetical protein